MRSVAPCLLLACGCGVRHGAPEGSPGHVSQANHECANLFCAAEKAVDSGGKCAPSCACGGYEFSEPSYDEHDLHALRSWKLLNPTQPLEVDPFAEATRTDDGAPVYCAAIPVDPSPAVRTYRIETFPTERAARQAGGQVTHSGRCGACSSFQNLAAYIERRDLNRAGRLCGLGGTFGSKTQLRRPGLSSAIARPCLDAEGYPAVYPVEHYYFR